MSALATAPVAPADRPKAGGGGGLFYAYWLGWDGLCDARTTLHARDLTSAIQQAGRRLTSGRGSHASGAYGVFVQSASAEMPEHLRRS